MTNKIKYCEVCGKVLTGRAMKYCKEDQKQGLAIARGERMKALPPKPVTRMTWLHNFDGWLKSGKSYADFQKGEWLNAASQIHTHTA